MAAERTRTFQGRGARRGMRFRRLGAGVALLALGLGSTGCVPEDPVAHVAQLGELTLRYEQVARLRESRTQFLYDFAATLENGTDAGLGAIEVSVTGGGPGTAVVEGTLRFDALPAGGTSPSVAPFRLRQDRTQAFDPGGLRFEVDTVGAPLAASRPAPGATDVPPAAWLELDFQGRLLVRELRSLGLACEGGAVPVDRYQLESGQIVLNPDPALPADTACTVAWPGPDGIEMVTFATGPAPTATVPYDRDDPTRVAPFPDDLWLEPDASTPTGHRVAYTIPQRPDDVRSVLRQLRDVAEKAAGNAAGLDGWSPVGGFVVELSEAVDPTSLPADAEASLSPHAAVQLLDLTGAAHGQGRRVPIEIYPRSARRAGQSFQHALVIHPAIPLGPGERYGLVVTNQVRTLEGGAFAASPFFEAVAGPPRPGEPAPAAQVRPLADEVLEAATEDLDFPIPREDVALALRASIRSTQGFQDDLLAIRETLALRPPPSYTITDVRDSFSPHVAAIVEGTFELPEWRAGNVLGRDANGAPQIQTVREHPFILALPTASLTAPAPVTIYQHGNPGSAGSEVPAEARDYLGEAGFAVIGLTDTLNSEIGEDQDAQTLTVFASILGGAFPDYWMQTTAAQLALVRLIRGSLGDLDVLPRGAPDGQPDLAPGLPLTYMGVSEGANNGPGLLPYAPEIRAAALVAGGGRLGEILFFQDAVGPGGVGTATLDLIDDVIPNVQPLDLWVGYQLFQLAHDPQERALHGTFLYRDPPEVGGTTRKASVLLQEGVGDTSVPNNATRSVAWGMGPLPHLAPVAERVPLLQEAFAPLQANVDLETSAAFVQFVPDGHPDLPPSPGCETEDEGHYCPQTAAPARQQRRHFFETAVTEDAPEILEPAF